MGVNGASAVAPAAAVGDTTSRPQAVFNVCTYTDTHTHTSFSLQNWILVRALVSNNEKMLDCRPTDFVYFHDCFVRPWNLFLACLA